MSSQGGQRRPGGAGGTVLVAFCFALALLLAPAGVRPIRAAEDLSLEAAATYTLRPDDGLVRVVVDVTARNNKPDAVSPGPSGPIRTQFYYSGASFAIQAEATRIRATTGGRPLSVSTRERRGYLEATVAFERDLFFGKSTKLRLTFDLPGGRPRSASDIRVNGAFVAFFAWAFGDAGSVRIVVPPGFEAQTSGDELSRADDAGRTILSAGRVEDATSWYAAVIAERRDGLTHNRLRIATGESVVVRAWPGDAVWNDEVSDLLTRGLPVLDSLIGLPWPVADDLVVTEVHTPLLEGYAGIYNPATDEIEISEDLDDLTTLHEASHAWFNGDLFQERWINEGLADTYAALALERIGVAKPSPDAVSPTGGAAFPLEAWPPPGRVDDAETEASEAYGYNASWTVMAAIVADLGDERMRDVFDAADRGAIAYRGAPEPETVGGGTPDWRRFLDLLEELGGSDEAGELFERWVVPANDLPRLEERAAARERYAALVAAGGDWLPPLAIRRPMSQWSFDAALAGIETAKQLLALRDEIDRRSGALGVTPPGTLETAYEAAASEADLDAARPIAVGQLDAIGALEGAEAALSAPRDFVTAVGLWGADPGATYASAEAEFQANDLDRAGDDARAAKAVLDGAPDAGRGRLLAGAGAGVATITLVGGGAWWAVRRRRSATLPANPPEAGPVPPATADDEQGGDAP
jgi:hypothetical protein